MKCGRLLLEHSVMVKKLCRLEIAIFLGIWLLLTIFARSRLFRDPGTFWHTVVGERILSTGKLIYTDPFSFTHGGEHWIAQNWLGECIMALIHRVAGFDSLLLASVTLLAFFYAWMAHRLLCAGLHPLLALFIISLAMAASSHNFHVRPHLATMVFLGLTLAMLADFETALISLRTLFWLVPLYVLWANIHGGFLGGIATLLLVIGGWILMWLLGRKSPLSGIRQALVLVALVILCGLTAFVNPYGVELPKAWYSIVSSPLLPKIIIEHAPLASSKSIMVAVLPAVLVYIMALAGVLPRRPRVTWLVPLVWLCLGWARARNAPLFTVAFAIVMADMLPNVRWFQWFSRKGSEICKLRDHHESAGTTRVTQFIIPVTVIALTITLQAAGIRVPVFGSGWAKLDPGHWPVGLVGELKTISSQKPAGTKIFNSMLYGGFLIYYTPRLRVFIDDRCELYGDEGLSAYMQVQETPDLINRLAQELGFEFALVENSSPLDQYLSRSGNWSILKRSECATLFRRISEPMSSPTASSDESVSGDE
jgi:hypothetical protein